MMINRAQTVVFFQDDFKKEIEKIADDMLFFQPGTDELSKLRVFKQALPIPQREAFETDMSETIEYADDSEEKSVFKCPWCLIKLDGGIVKGIGAVQEVGVAICFGIYNPSPQNQGHMEILNLIQRVYQRFAVNDSLAEKYFCQGNFEWALQDEDTYPYFFGAISTSFTMEGFQREDRYGFA